LITSSNDNYIKKNIVLIVWVGEDLKKFLSWLESSVQYWVGKNCIFGLLFVNYYMFNKLIDMENKASIIKEY
jgi:hypothetical protein